MHEPIRRLLPIAGEIGKLAIVDDNQQIEVRAVSFFGLRLVDPATPRIGSEQDDFQDAATLLEVR